MIDGITTIVKYLHIVLMVLYTVSSVFALLIKDKSNIRWNYHMMLFYAYVMHFTGFLVLFLQTGKMEYVTLYVVELIFFIMYPTIFHSLYRCGNRLLMGHMMFFLSIGSVMLARLNMEQATKQVVLIILSAVATLIIPKFIEKLERAKKVAAVLGVLGLLLLIAVLAVGMVTGSDTYGANLSLSLGGFSIQPSELVKVSFVFLIAMLFRKRDDFRRVCFATGIAAVHVVVLVLSKDLGSALIFFLTYLIMLYMATMKVFYVFAGLAAGTAASVVAYKLFSHVRVRVLAWIDPWSRIETSGYQVAMSLFALSAGGWLGTGLTKGRPGLVPVVTKDFIISAIAEEMGGIVAILLIFICFLCLWNMLGIAGRMEVMFYRLIGLGLATVYGVQVILTVGGALKFIPSTGVTLPLVSYGGSSILGTFVMFSVLQGIYNRKQEEVERFERERREELQRIEEQRLLEEKKKAALRGREEKKPRTVRTQKR